ncbi:MAG: hypothetical protein N5P05_003057 [Chroococcopsis gigantea SAG 12.99]|jgi:hypothetical protein|nr:hypothetical protein [Chlorogloea purpurea SAG 13.99]MDV3001451.1 hypothetical protein [Chroococcopsis gigantea SAG 12.99]
MTNERVEVDMYDRGIVPAETAARKEREGDAYKHIPEKEAEAGLDTTGGYTVDKEGLLNNYAVEPEMYYEVPGDAAETLEAETEERAAELEDINDNDEQGKLTSGKDERGKGVGII